MQPRFEELDYQSTPLGEVILRRRTMQTLDNVEVYEIMLGSDFLMSSLFTVVEEALSTLGLTAAGKNFPDLAGPEPGLDVVVGGLGLGYTARVALDHRAHGSVRDLIVVDYLQPVIDWHEQGLIPLGAGLTADPRCRFEHGDFFKRAVQHEGVGFDSHDAGRKFHAILLDIDHSPDHLLNERHASFYQVDGLRQMTKQLHPGGVFALWSDDPPEARFMKALNEVFATCETHVVPFNNPILGRDSESTVYVAATHSDAIE